MIDLDAVVAGYRRAVRAQGMPEPTELRIDHHPAPHVSPPLPGGWGAVYLFALCERHGTNCEAGPHRVLKVGKAGPSSGPRFQYQHYSPRSARSNLARSLLAHRVLWPYLGIENLDETSVALWLKNNTDRFSIYIPASDYPAVAATLETYVRGVLGSVFEGSA